MKIKKGVINLEFKIILSNLEFFNLTDIKKKTKIVDREYTSKLFGNNDLKKFRWKKIRLSRGALNQNIWLSAIPQFLFANSFTDKQICLTIISEPLKYRMLMTIINIVNIIERISKFLIFKFLLCLIKIYKKIK